MIRQESGFRPCSVSPKGAQGLMQLIPQTTARQGLTDPLDPRHNVNAGAKLLKQPVRGLQRRRRQSGSGRRRAGYS